MSEADFDYEKLLDRTMDEIGDGPKVIPEGTWLLAGVANIYKSSEETGGAPKVMFVFIPEKPADDVDEGVLASVGDDWKERQFFSVNVETGSDAAQVRNVLKALGVDLGTKTIRAALQENKALIRGKRVWATAGHRTYVSKKTNTEQTAVNWSDFKVVE